MINLNFSKYILLPTLLIIVFACSKNDTKLSSVSYAQFEEFVNETKYKTDAETYGWSIVQKDVYNFITVDGANWKKPDGINDPTSKNLPVTQVSYNDAAAYCKWAGVSLPSYEEYWEFVKNDNRRIVSDNKYPITPVTDANIVGNVWDITEASLKSSIRLAGGSLFCSKETCHGTVKERELFVDKETANIHVGFSVIVKID